MGDALPSREESIRKVNAHLARFEQWLTENNDEQLDANLMRNYTVVDASATGMVAVEVDLSKQYANGGGTLHGGAVGLILDMFTTTAYITLPSFDVSDDSYRIPGGYSWAMHYSCLRPLPLPARARVESHVVYSGKRMTLIKGAIMSLDGSKTYYVGEHHKVTSSESQSGQSRAKI